MNFRNVIILTGLVLTVITACQKAEDGGKPTDERLSRPYCNDPEAINYNWNFPGTPDNSTCFYPDEIFNGTYKITDSTFDGTYKFDTASLREFTITISSEDRRHLKVSGYPLHPNCTLNNVALTADRYYRASIDSTFLPPPDSSLLGGLSVCGTDTISGYFTRIANTDLLQLSLTIRGDTGTYYRKGTAHKQ